MMKNLKTRREALKLMYSGASSFLLAQYLGSYSQSAHAFDNHSADVPGLEGLKAPDKNGIMLREGYSSRIIAKSSQRVTSKSTYKWHSAPDGGACFPDGKGWIYVSNSEMDHNTGGVGAIRFDHTGEIIDAYSILDNTTENCNGGGTPWNTWLSCEEYEKGLVWECDPYGRKSGFSIPSLGVFEHEAVAVDMKNRCVYMSEDVDDGGFYRFVADDVVGGRLTLEQGKLQVAQLDRNGFVTWLNIPDPLALREETRYQTKSTAFDGGEGVWLHGDNVLLTTKGDDRVWSYNIKSQKMTILYDDHFFNEELLKGVDHISTIFNDEIAVCEDGGHMRIVTIAKNARPQTFLRVVGQDESEITGLAMAPDQSRFYFSSQTGPRDRDHEGITYEIYRHR